MRNEKKIRKDDLKAMLKRWVLPKKKPLFAFCQTCSLKHDAEFRRV